jgi:hypothetical protein
MSLCDAKIRQYRKNEQSITRRNEHQVTESKRLSIYDVWDFSAAEIYSATGLDRTHGKNFDS